jgi:hypothetical protein
MMMGANISLFTSIRTGFWQAALSLGPALSSENQLKRWWDHMSRNRDDQGAISSRGPPSTKLSRLR